MAETKQYQPTAVEQDLRAWLVASLDGFTDPAPAVLYANQGAVRQVRPFVMLQVLTDFMVSDPVERVTDTQLADGSYEVEVTEQRQGSVQVMTFGSLSWSMSRAIARSLRRGDVLALNKANGIEIMAELTGITDVPEALSTSTEPRRMQDFSFAYCEVTTLPTGAGVLERVVATGDIGGVAPVVDESWPTP